MGGNLLTFLNLIELGTEFGRYWEASLAPLRGFGEDLVGLGVGCGMALAFGLREGTLSQKL